jgi:DNA-binding MarR family transcriptional regulator
MEGVAVTASKPLGFDPIEEAHRQWIEHGWPEAADGMSLITSVIRAQQIFLARIDTVLRPLNLTFARFELLTLLSFTSAGRLPMNKLGDRLQVHPTSVTSSVDRLEAQGLVLRLAHATDRRTTLVEILPTGRRALKKATTALNKEVFVDTGISGSDTRTLLAILRKLRVAQEDFTS